MTTSPTCIATFADGEVTRMTTWSSSGKPDLRRGIKLAQFAYETRMHNRRRKPRSQTEEPAPTIPPITEARFETSDGKVLATFTAEQIAEVGR
jgi:hypothetical protein